MKGRRFHYGEIVKKKAKRKRETGWNRALYYITNMQSESKHGSWLYAQYAAKRTSYL